MLGPNNVNATSGWLPKMAMLGLKWRDYDLEVTLNDCHAWFPLNYCDLELAIKDGHAWSQMM